jgi:hypothetical protein
MLIKMLTALIHSSLMLNSLESGLVIGPKNVWECAGEFYKDVADKIVVIKMRCVNFDLCLQQE